MGFIKVGFGVALLFLGVAIGRDIAAAVLARVNTSSAASAGA